ncbi:hypothetical protein D9Q98_008645 [Chlorella vulgaris]|uniref:Uncharacterized protein n=1 Tax=Chlorella vulgaris TaxID=3077 RepID=A0A9D4YU31_CHLVU|nr:hypothetical protein D9Q98_008645 [Chlorella vulgaris]
MLAISNAHNVKHCVSARTQAARPQRSVRVGSAKGSNKGGSGIHDPIGWGQRGGAVKPHETGMEEAAHLEAAHLAAETKRTEKLQPGGAGVNRREAAQREILEVQREKGQAQAPAQEKVQAVEQATEQAQPREASQSDDEWEHMPAPKKWLMEAKALLYSWLRTGVEPL